MRIGNRIVCWLSLFGLLTVQSVDAETDPELPIRMSGVWKVVESPNFRCWSRLPDADVRQLAESCEVWRVRLRSTWITGAVASTWVPKCDVFVHANQAAYNQALNRPGDTSVGSTMMNFDQGRTVMRRIDVRSDASDWSNAALPHELTHVVLGERFGGHALPRWADEGIAMLSESTEKHRERLTSLQEIVGGRPSLSMVELLKANRIPAPHLRDAFYSQSLAVSSLLIRRSTPATFADFVEETTTAGMETALRNHYQLDGIAGLQREWNEWIRRPESMKFVSLPIQTGATPNLADGTNR